MLTITLELSQMTERSSRVLLRYKPKAATTRPAFTSSDTSACASKAPRSLNTLNPGAVFEPAQNRVGRADHHELLAPALDLLHLVRVARVHKTMAPWQDDVERKSLCKLWVRLRNLFRRHVTRHWVDRFTALLRFTNSHLPGGVG
jgi:hypothetical protein